MHPALGPPSDPPGTRSVWKVLFFQVFAPQPALPSDISARPLPNTVFFITVLGAPSLLMAIPVCELPLTTLPSTRFRGDSIKIPSKLLLSALFSMTLSLPLKMATPPCWPATMPLLLMMLSSTTLLSEKLEISTPTLTLPEISFERTMVPLAEPSPTPSPPLAVTTFFSSRLSRPVTAMPTKQAFFNVIPVIRDDEAERSIPSLKPDTVPTSIRTPETPPETKTPAKPTFKLHVVFDMVWPAKWKTTLLAVMTTPLTAPEHARSPVRTYSPGALRVCPQPLAGFTGINVCACAGPTANSRVTASPKSIDTKHLC